MNTGKVSDCEDLANGAKLWHHVPMPTPKPQKQELPGKNPSDPMILAGSVVKATIDGPLTVKKPRKKLPAARKSK